MKRWFALFCGLLVVTFSATAFATLDRTHVTVTNNTDEPVTIQSTLSTTDPDFKAGKDWQDMPVTLEPYQTREVLWFVRNLGVKLGHNYQFLLTASHSDSTSQLKVGFDEKAKPVYGSDLKAFLTLPDEAQKPFLDAQSFAAYPALAWHEGVSLHARTWRPTMNLFNNFHLVIDKPDSHTYPAPDNNQISVLTYNTQMMPFYAGTVDDLNQPKERANEIPLTITQYDVVVLEELFDRELRNIVIDKMSANYPYHTRVVGDGSSKVLTGGVIIFSKWPIENEAQVIYLASSGADSLAAKGAGYAILNKQGRRYHVFATHLEAGNSAAAVKARDQQLLELENFIERQGIPANEPVLIGGDFNVNEFGPEVNMLQDSLNVKLLENTGFKYSSDAETNLMTVDKTRERIDYVFYQNGHLAPIRAWNHVFINRALSNEIMWPKFDLSDHYPVASYFMF